MDATGVIRAPWCFLADDTITGYGINDILTFPPVWNVHFHQDAPQIVNHLEFTVGFLAATFTFFGCIHQHAREFNRDIKKAARGPLFVYSELGGSQVFDPQGR